MDAGEVFVLLNQLNEDWVWGQSQRTGECGLIPLLLMEDVVIQLLLLLMAVVMMPCIF